MNAGEPHLPSDAETRHAPELTPADIDERVRWARRQGYVAWFWPDVPVDAWRASLLEIERVSTALLPLELKDRTSHRSSRIAEIFAAGDADARTIGIAAFTSGMGPLLGSWIERGRLRASRAVASVLALHLDHSRKRARRMRLATDAALDVLGDIGLRPILIKAAHTSRTLFAEPGLRPAADIDIVVEQSRFREAEAVLANAGYRLVKRRRNPRKSDWFPPGAPDRLQSLDFTHETNPFTIEMHGSLDREFYGVRTLRFGFIAQLGLVDAPALHTHARVLAQPLLSTYLAAHASEELHQLQLIRLVELALLLRRDSAAGDLDWRELDAMLSDRTAHRFTYPAFSLVERLAPGTIDPWFYERLDGFASKRMKNVLERMSPATAQRLDELSLDERFLWAEGSVEILRRTLHLFRPPSDGRSMVRHWTDRITRLARGRVSIRRDDTNLGSGPPES